MLVEPEWLAAYIDAAERWPEAGYFGGELIPGTNAHLPRGSQGTVGGSKECLSCETLGKLMLFIRKRESFRGEYCISSRACKGTSL